VALAGNPRHAVFRASDELLQVCGALPDRRADPPIELVAAVADDFAQLPVVMQGELRAMHLVRIRSVRKVHLAGEHGLDPLDDAALRIELAHDLQLSPKHALWLDATLRDRTGADLDDQTFDPSGLRRDLPVESQRAKRSHL
jgi:hypothetical protein